MGRAAYCRRAHKVGVISKAFHMVAPNRGTVFLFAESYGAGADLFFSDNNTMRCGAGFNPMVRRGLFGKTTPHRTAP